MNWLDLVLGIILLLSLIGAVRNGLSREVVRLLALAAGVVGGLWWYDRLAVSMEPFIGDPDVAAFASFAVILTASLIGGAAIAWGLAKLLGWAGLRWFDRLLGAAFGAVRGMVLAAAVVLAVVAFAPVSGSAKVVADSFLAPWVLHGARAAAGLAPDEFKALFEQRFDQVREVWRQGPTRTVRAH